MCRSKTDPNEKKHYNANETKHGVTDLIPLAVFIACVVVGFVVGIIGMNAGNPESLLYGTDYTGVTCGSANNHLATCPYDKDDSSKCDMTNRIQITYPRMNDDVIQMVKDGIDFTDPTALKFTGVCVTECPKAQTYTCTDDILLQQDPIETPGSDLSAAFIAKLDACRLGNEGIVVASQWNSVGGDCGTLMQKCWYNDIAGKETFFRCFPNYNESTFYGCDNDADGIVDAGAEIRDKPYGTDEASKCKTMIKTIQSQQPAQKNFLMEQLNTFATIFGRYLGDIRNGFMVIMVIGVGFATAMGFAWLFLLKKFARCMVWTIVALVLALYVLVTLFFFVKAGMIDNPLQATTGTIEVDTTSQDLWKACAYIMLILTIVQFMLTAYFGKKINIAAAIIQEASKAIGEMPLLMAFPIFPCVIIVGLILWFLYGAAAIYTMADVSGVTEVASTAAGNATAGITDVPDSAMKDYLLVFHFFMFLWMNQFVQGIALMVIAGAVTTWYFRPREMDEDGRPLKGNPILNAVKRTLFFHAGSVAFGSFLVAVVQLLRAILAYLDKQSQNAQKKNCILKLIFKCVACCLWCFEKCVKYICRQAYVIVIMDSKSFCAAAFSVFGLLTTNTAQMGLVAMISTYVMLLGKVVIDLACVAACYLWLSSDTTYTDDTKATYVSNALFPTLICAMVAHFVASVFLTVYDMAIETILIAYLRDKDNNEPGEYYMGESLNKFMKKPAKALKNVGPGGDDEEDADKSEETRQSSNADEDYDENDDGDMI